MDLSGAAAELATLLRSGLGSGFPGLPPGAMDGSRPRSPSREADGVQVKAAPVLQGQVVPGIPGGPLAASKAMPPPKKRKRATDGLAPNRNIKQGGAVTVYSGFSAVTVAPQPKREAAPQASPQPPSGLQATEALPRQLPEGWEMRRSRTKNAVYYVNEKLGKTQWEPPEGSSLKPSMQSKKKGSVRLKESPAEAAVSSMNGVMGLVRAADQRTSKWQRWQHASAMLNTDDD